MLNLCYFYFTRSAPHINLSPTTQDFVLRLALHVEGKLWIILKQTLKSVKFLNTGFFLKEYQVISV